MSKQQPETLEMLAQRLVEVENHFDDRMTKHENHCDDRFTKGEEKFTQVDESIRKNTETVQCAVDQLESIYKRTEGVVQLHEDFAGVARLGGYIRKFGMIVGSIAFAVSMFVIAWDHFIDWAKKVFFS